LGLLVEGYRVSPYGSLLSLVVDLLATTFRIYSPSALALFSILGWTVSTSFRALRHEIEDAAKSCEQFTDRTAASRLMKWKRSHLAVCECAHQLNRTFGIILLIILLIIEITFIFFDVITGSFFILFTIVENTTTSGTWVPLTVSWNAFHLTNLLVMTSVSDKLTHEVRWRAVCD
jgi:7tm Chemosensory receptor